MANSLSSVIGLNSVFGGRYKSEKFTSNGTFNIPPGARWIYVTCIGGGGGGGSGDSIYGGGGGGGGGSVLRLPFYADSELLTSVSVTVGGNGVGNTGSGDGTAGGTSSFGSYISCTGGAGGKGGPSGDPDGGAGGNVTISGRYLIGQFSHTGGAGGAGGSGGNGGSGSIISDMDTESPWVDWSSGNPHAAPFALLRFSYSGGGGGGGGNSSGGSGGDGGDVRGYAPTQATDALNSDFDGLESQGPSPGVGQEGGAGGCSHKGGIDSSTSGTPNQPGTNDWGAGGCGSDRQTGGNGGNGGDGIVYVEYFI